MKVYVLFRATRTSRNAFGPDGVMGVYASGDSAKDAAKLPDDAEWRQGFSGGVYAIVGDDCWTVDAIEVQP